MQTAGYSEYKLDSSVASILRWNGAQGQHPSRIYVKLLPTAFASGLAWVPMNGVPLTPPSAAASVGRFSEFNYNPISPEYVYCNAWGPTHKEATVDSSGLASVPAQSFFAKASLAAGTIGEIWVSGTYGWSVLPLLNVSFVEDDDEEVPNYHKGPGNTRVRNQRDRDGKQELDVAIFPFGDGWHQYGKFRTSYGAYTLPRFSWGFEDPVDYTLPSTSDSLTFLYYRDGMPDFLNPLVLLTHELDDADQEAPEITQETRVNWHYPNENFDLRDQLTRWEEFDTAPISGKEETCTIDICGTADYRIYFSPVHTFAAEDLANKLSWVLDVAVIDWLPWKVLGTLIKILGFDTPGSLYPQSHDRNINWDTAWNADYSYWDGERRAQARPPSEEQHYYEIKPGHDGEVYFTYYWSDGFGYEGFTGINRHSYATWTKGTRKYGYFVDLRG